MSFGFSIGDFVTLSAFAWQVYKSCKDSSVDFQSLSQDVASLHIILKESVEQIQDQQIQTGRREQLTTLCDNCRNVLTDISACLEKYESLGTQSQRAWDRMRWGLEDIACLRQRLLTTINLLTAFNTSIANSSQIRIEKKLNKLLAEIRSGKREGSIVSAKTIASISSENQEAWRLLRQELDDMGIGTSLFLHHRSFVVAWFQQAFAAGAFEEGASGDVKIATVQDTSKFPVVTEEAALAAAFYPRILEKGEPMERNVGRPGGVLKRALQGFGARIATRSKGDTGAPGSVKALKGDKPPPRKLILDDESSERDSPTSKSHARSLSTGDQPSGLDIQHTQHDELQSRSISSGPRSATAATARVTSHPSVAPRPRSQEHVQYVMSLHDELHKWPSSPLRQSASALRSESNASLKRCDQEPLSPLHQDAYDKHEAVLRDTYYARSAAETAKMASARRSLKLGAESRFERPVAPAFFDLASSGMEMVFPSPPPKALALPEVPIPMKEAGLPEMWFGWSDQRKQ